MLQIMDASSLGLKDMECPICHDYYKEPKILPCAHLLCRNCLVSWMTTNENALCPLCRCAIVDPHNRALKTCDDVVDQFPSDLVMSEMVENIKTFNQNRVCYVHEEMKAISFCQQCGVMLCTTCAAVHRKIPATSLHKLEDLETLTLESLTSNRQSPCSAHPDKASEHYCVTHEILICSGCAHSKHRACPEVPFLNEILETNKRLLSDIEHRLRDVESTLNQIIEEIEERMVTVEQITKISLTHIDAACDRLLLSIENCRKHLKRLVRDENDSIMADFKTHKDALGIKRGLISSHRSLVNRIQLSGSGTSLVTMVPRLTELVSDLDLNASLMSDWKPRTTAKLTIDEKVISRIELELARLGHMNANYSLPEEQSEWQFHRKHGGNIVMTNHGMTAEVRGMSCGSGLVFSSEPIKVNMLYEVRVEGTDAQNDRGNVGFGIVTEDPAKIVNVLVDGSVLHSASVVYGDDVYIKNQSTRHNCGVAYKTFKVGSRIGVAVDAARRLHIYVDGKDQGVVCRKVQLPCWAVFDLLYFLKKVTVLPLTSVP